MNKQLIPDLRDALARKKAAPLSFYAVNALGWSVNDTAETAKAGLEPTASGNFLVLSYDGEKHPSYNINFYIPVGVECTCIENNDWSKSIEIGEIFIQ